MLIDLTGRELHNLYLKVRSNTYRSEGWVTTFSRDRIVFDKISKMSNKEICDIIGKVHD
ncbi:hypothetical protein PQC39_gp005 [Vibrio phage Vp_R1]|uniref:Uncharacterized protein n=1 Tax=Vibrio phage Vp_R1 TaxID=2059867 RepID=A0A2H5BPV9_9CAUD|nr:hypothetical protein PQC39_gp005 [Vibrio phage Vp_R1]AUG88369.1 hypothetical protein VPR_005 [Vibrio phage Vp_R1]